MKKTLLTIVLVLILLTISIAVIDSLSIHRALRIMQFMLRRDKNISGYSIDFFTIRYLISIIVAIVISLPFLLAPKKYIYNKWFSITFFVFSLLLLILWTFRYISSYNNVNWISIWIITIQPIYFYIIWSIFLLVNFLVNWKKSSDKIKLKTKNKFLKLDFTLNKPKFFSKIPVWWKYTIIQIIISIPVFLIKDLSNLFLLWCIWILVFLFSMHKGKLKYFIIIALISLIWILGVFSSDRYNYLTDRYFKCNTFVEIQDKELCYVEYEIKSAIERWWLFGVWYKNWKWIGAWEIISDNIFAWIWEEFWKMGLLFLVWIYIMLFWSIHRYTKQWLKENYFWELIIIWLSSYIFLNIAFHILSNLGILPNVSFNLPFIWYWSSALMSYFLAMSFIVRFRES